MSLPPYAPVTSVLPSMMSISSSQAAVQADLNKQISLYDSSSPLYNREILDSLLEIYSIIVLLEQVEKSYLKGNISSSLSDSDEQYTTIVTRLLDQYNSILKIPEVKQRFANLSAFTVKYKLNTPLAIRRIQNAAVNKNTANNNGGKGNVSSKAVAEATGAFITLMDALKLDYKAKDQLYPLLSDLIIAVNNIIGEPDDSDDDDDDDENINGPSQSKDQVKKLDFKGRQQLVQWLVKLNNMNVNDELSDDEKRQFSFDLDIAYKNFYTSLE